MPRKLLTIVTWMLCIVLVMNAANVVIKLNSVVIKLNGIIQVSKHLDYYNKTVGVLLLLLLSMGLKMQ